MNEVRYSFAEANPLLHVRLLGGFRVERADAGQDERADIRQAVSDWPRRSAKTLTKLLATYPGHALHREQIIDILWPDVDPESGLNSFGKALHAARRVLEPDLPRRQDSAYLRLADSMLVLNTERVVVDVDMFEHLSEDAIRTGEIDAYQSALVAYSGELLPEDRYETWCAERRSVLADMHLRLLVELAEVYERCGACNEAADKLREVLRLDPTREAVHRQLMRLYARMGTPDQAVRQFHICEEVLRRELDLVPQPETVSLYDAIRANQLSPASGLERVRDRVEARGSLPAPVPHRSVFVGRERVLQSMSDHLMRRDETRVGMIVVSGEAGVGKTRLLEEFASRASEQGVVTLRGGKGAHANQFACGPFAVALEDYVARLPAADRHEVARQYPALARFVPSLWAGIPLQEPAPELRDYHLDIIPSIVQFLTGLARATPVLLVLGDLHEIDEVGWDLIRYLAHLAANMPLLMVGALRDPDIEAGAGSWQMIEAMTREQLWLRIELRCLSPRATAQLVRAMTPGVKVSEDILTEIYEQSRGNPLFVRELVEGMRGDSAAPGGGAREPGWPGAPLPARALARTALRVALTDKALHRVLGLAAIAGAAGISLSQLRAGAAALEPPLAVPVLFDALDRALRMRLLEERDGGYAFRHPVVRVALYDSLPLHRRDEFRTALTGSSAQGITLAERLSGLLRRQGFAAGSPE
ncbi:MAG TPA: AAA family ATPase [Streptosporangiaceae bacterium]|jgi:DNA-binding SARP family transcriptional activator|nr:AAA family ATPase [Streptosporangiaceae bacterium]